MHPQDLRYSKDHEWIRVDGERGTVGITDYAQKQLGDVVFVELPAPGRTLRAGESFGSVESVKAVSELFAPVAGEVLEANAALQGNPETINSDPHGAGWMLVLKLANPAEAQALMDATRYEAHIQGEGK
jgi:glycine cleavage system H protein